MILILSIHTYNAHNGAHNSIGLSSGAARALIDYTLRRRGLNPWPKVWVDAFSGGGETLLIARPDTLPQVTLADYAQPFLKKYLIKK